jgi:hypothetical protein
MSGTTISGSYTTGITLSNPATQNPATISDTGNIDTTSASALYGTNVAPWSVYNGGTVIGHSRGVFLTAGGTVSNAASGLISSLYRGVDVTGGSGIITNAGSIAGGTLQGVRLANGGVVTNLAGGTISGGGTYSGVALVQGGTVSNASGAVIHNGVRVDGAPGTVVNNGTIDPVSYRTVYLTSGGILNNGGVLDNRVQAVSSAATVENSGTIKGITLGAGGTVSNAANGYIGFGYGGYQSPGYQATGAIYIRDTAFTPGSIADTIVNAGTIGGTNPDSPVIWAKNAPRSPSPICPAV